mmetsp:Transcript_40643/g.88652  ORF Transcript_40643/g.88652 Transcript_40643/m.88652 type:complete len:105 (-) Transcript_40643:404-718(-)
MEIVLINNPLSRKNMVRSSLLKKLPRLKFIDGKEVTSQERESSMHAISGDSQTSQTSQNTLVCLNSMDKGLNSNNLNSNNLNNLNTLNMNLNINNLSNSNNLTS